MAYSRKPKDLTKFIHDIGVSQAQHTWEYADKVRLAQAGSSAQTSFADRRLRELNRKTVGTYSQSRIATTHIRMRREISEFTKKEHAKIESSTQDSIKKIQPPGLSERPIPNPPLFRRQGL